MSHDGGDYIGDELELFSLAHNWKAYWSRKVAPDLGQTVLDVGAGIGSNIELLKSPQMAWTALEPDRSQADQIRQRFNTSAGVVTLCGTLGSLDEQQRFDSIIYIDVLEHIEADKDELDLAASHLKQGGRIVVLSPAHNSLFSPFDKSVGHCRRYDKSSLSLTQPRGTSIKKLYYLDSVGYAASWLNAKLLKSAMPSKSQIAVWDRLMVPLSRIFDRLIGYRFGKTIVMVLEKD